MNFSRKVFLIVSCFIFSILKIGAQNNNISHEVRAVWLTTNWNLDWPSTAGNPEQQKKEILKILDQLESNNFNTIFFQVRIRGDVFYKSQIEPWSPFFKKEISVGSKTSYDPLEYVIQEAHKRGIECHAWFVTFPVGTPKQVKAQGKQSVVSKYPDMCILYQGEWYLDPGNPKTSGYITRLVDEIVSNYDIDGIQFDYIRYPEAAKKFPDQKTYKRYSSGQSLESWRRDNITNLVFQINKIVRAKKPWVQISCSPIGRYRDLDPKRGTWTAYGSVHQDAGLWLKEGLIDAVYPMLYYNEDNFDRYVDDWINNSNGRLVVPGLGVYRLLESEGNWSPQYITKQIDYTRKSESRGQAYYRTANVLNNYKGIKDSLAIYYKYPAKQPALTWLNNIAPNSPVDFQVYNKNEYTVLEWKPADGSIQQTYTIYETSTENCDMNDVSRIVMTGIHTNKLYLKTEDLNRGVYYSVTASDRFHNESVPCFPVFYIMSKTLEK